MAKQQPRRYAQKTLMRRLERAWSRLEGQIDRAGRLHERLQPYNPLYHLGTLAIFLLLVLTVTGLYLTIFYRPGTDRAYASVARLATLPLGSLMRGVHRYAADALIVVTLLHAFKMLLSDRFWGSRWVAWVTGWVLVLTFWLVGVMGYWLVWDDAAQWLTEIVLRGWRGPVTYSFLGPNPAASTYALFVIVLFLHVFIPVLFVLGLMLHLARLTRSRVWAPRWLMLGGSVALLVVTALRPVMSGLPADLNRLGGVISIDWLYMGFLPALERLGSPVTWGLTILVFAVAIMIPWLRSGQHDGPAFVIEAQCTGCAVCARECPYEAIIMEHRDDESPYSSIAVVNPGRCTGCGICVGACHDDAIELTALHAAVMRQDLHRALGQAQKDGQPSVTIFACERHATLGTLPPLVESRPVAGRETSLALGGTIPLLRAKLPPRINAGYWPDSEGELRPVLTCVVPCTGMIHPNWAAESIEAGGAGAIVVSCPDCDCGFREGPVWIADRLKRRRTFRQGNTHFWELAPGSGPDLAGLWRQMAGGATASAAASRAATVVGRSTETRPVPSGIATRLRRLAPGSLVLLIAFLVSSLLVSRVERPVAADEAAVRLIINHVGRLKASAAELDEEFAARLPENVNPAAVLGGERFPVELRLVVDGQIVREERFESGGLRREGAIYGQITQALPAGAYHLAIWLRDDGAEWRPVFDGPVAVTAGRVTGLLWDQADGVFKLQ